VKGRVSSGRRTGKKVDRASGAPRVPRALPVDLPLVELDVDVGASPPHWLRELTGRWAFRVRVETCRPTGARSGSLLQVVEITGDPGDLGEAERHLRQRADLEELTILALSPSRRYVRTVSRLPSLCRRIFQSGAICGTCRFSATDDPPGRERWTLVAPRTPAVLRAVATAQAGPEGAPSPIRRMRRFVPARTLTPRQTTALETAYRLGYYAFPRRTNLQEVSRILGVSRSTTAELLRRAEHKMLFHELGLPRPAELRGPGRPLP